nr:PREDICTED: acyl-coenzyme A thioesterase 3-like [Latimeria chalumnae]|eukprot:XP_006012961.1 PREDICTED: acyl-coenzyme A thioesterase 3-like [Latimeria chalumnae]
MEARHRNTAAPLIEVDPKRGLVDKPFELKVSFLPPNKPITLYSQLEREKNECWEAYAHYVSDSEGTVRVNQQESLGGSYSGREPMGLIWSMKPRPGSKPDLRLRPLVCEFVTSQVAFKMAWHGVVWQALKHD